MEAVFGDGGVGEVVRVERPERGLRVGEEGGVGWKFGAGRGEESRRKKERVLVYF